MLEAVLDQELAKAWRPAEGPEATFLSRRCRTSEKLSPFEKVLVKSKKTQIVTKYDQN